MCAIPYTNYRNKNIQAIAILAGALHSLCLGGNSFDYPNRGVKWDFDGRNVLGVKGQDICLWSAKNGRLIRTLKGHAEKIVSVEFSPNHEQALSCSGTIFRGVFVKSNDTSVRTWDIATGRPLRVFNDQVRGQFSPDSRYILTVRDTVGENVVTVWNGDTGAVLSRHKLASFDYQSDNLRWAPNGKAYLIFNGNAALACEASTGKPLWRTELSPRSPSGPEFSPDGRHWMTYNSNTICVWSSSSGKLEQKFHLQMRIASNDNAAQSAYFMPGSKTVAALQNNTIGIWDIKSGKLIRSAKSKGYPISLVLSHDAKKALCEMSTAPFNQNAKSVAIWDLRSMKEIHESSIHGYYNSKYVYSPLRNTFVCLDGPTVVEYSLSTGKILKSVTLEGL
jgi:WD40 repeat protein